MTNLIYTTQATTNGSARASKITFSDNPTELELGLPKELGGAGADKAYNPEHLFAATYASCFEGALHFLYNNQKTSVKPKHVSAKVDLLKREGFPETGFTIAVEITTTFSGITQAQGLEIVNQGHVVCPYSFATKGNIQLTNVVKID